jgi:succinate-acetate transporter protein
MSEAISGRPRYQTSFTVCLYVTSMLAAMMIFSHQIIIVSLLEKHGDSIAITVIRSLQAFEAILAVACLATAILRSKESASASHLTAAVSIVLIFWCPFGTAIFLWWVISIRRRERPASDALGADESGA